MGHYVRLIDHLAGKEIASESGSTEAHLDTIPHKGDLLSFARQAFEVLEVWHVHNGLTRLKVAKIGKEFGYPCDRPEIAELSFK